MSDKEEGESLIRTAYRSYKQLERLEELNNRYAPEDPTHRYVENPPKLLPPVGWVKMEITRDDLHGSSNRELRFYNGVKNLKGFIQKHEPAPGILFVCYVQPGSPAAVAFAKHWMWSRGLPAHHEEIRQLTGTTQCNNFPYSKNKPPK
jgi:hypothetical protein